MFKGVRSMSQKSFRFFRHILGHVWIMKLDGYHDKPALQYYFYCCAGRIAVREMNDLAAFRGYNDVMMMPSEFGGYNDILMMPNESRGYNNVMMMLGEYIGYNYVMIMPNKSKGYNDVMTMQGESERGNDDMIMLYVTSIRGHGRNIQPVALWYGMPWFFVFSISVLPEGLGYHGAKESALAEDTFEFLTICEDKLYGIGLIETYGCVNAMVMPGEFRGYNNVMMMAGCNDILIMLGESRGYNDVMIMPGGSGGYNDVMMIPGEFVGYNDVMMMFGESIGYNDIIMMPGESRREYSNTTEVYTEHGYTTRSEQGTEPRLER
ncbi:hypothetical protein BC332_07628 [Capsicum chinense]|nr:hypothetical protein BC332_07628 [Capsicum chinense]